MCLYAFNGISCVPYLDRLHVAVQEGFQRLDEVIGRGSNEVSFSYAKFLLRLSTLYKGTP